MSGKRPNSKTLISGKARELTLIIFISDDNYSTNRSTTFLPKALNKSKSSRSKKPKTQYKSKYKITDAGPTKIKAVKLLARPSTRYFMMMEKIKAVNKILANNLK